MTIQRIICLIALALPVLCISCKERDQYRMISTTDLEQRRPFKAVVEKVSIDDFGSMPSGLLVMIGLKTEGGDRIAIGGPQSGQDVAGFAKTLRLGKSYEFPKVWLDYKAKLPRPTP